MIDVKRLVILRDLAEYGTVTTVADLHQVTPSAVSQQLRALERESGAALVRREGRGVRLTAAGAALAAACEGVLAALERAEGAVRALDDHLSGELRIGCAPSALRTVAAPLLAQLAARHPLLRPRLDQVEPEEGVPLLRSGALDVVIAYRYHLLGTPVPAGTTAVPLFRDPLALAVPEALRAEVAAGGAGVLRDRAWISAPAPGACHAALLHVCRGAGFVPRVEHTVEDLRSALHLVATGLAVTLLPALLGADPPPGTAVLPLPGPGRVVEALVRAGTEEHPAVAATLAVLTGLTG